MIIDLASIRAFFAFLQSKLTKTDDVYRKNVYALIPTYIKLISEKLINLVQQKQDFEAEKLRKLSREKQGELAQDKVKLLDNINKVIAAICRYEAVCYCVANTFDKGINGCQEHATLLSLALIKLYGINKGPRVECIGFTAAGGNHELVVVGRQGDLEVVASWGANCLVIDSSGNWYSDIDHLPFATALSNLKLFGKFSGVTISILHQTNMYLDLLTCYEKDPKHPYHMIEKLTLNILTNYFDQMVSQILQKLVLPTLKLVDNPVHSIASFFSAASDTAIVETNRAEIKEIFCYPASFHLE